MLNRGQGPNKILLAIPCYNCEKQIERVISEFNEKLLGKLEIILVIDNKSTDGTLNSAVSAIHAKGIKNAKVIRNCKNYYLGGTHKVAFLEAKRMGCTHLAIVHGDNQGVTSELSGHIDFLERNPNFDAILGSRFMAGSRRFGYSKFRTYGNFVFNWIYSLVMWEKIEDVGGGTTLFSLTSFPKNEFLNFTDGFTFNNEMLFYLVQNRKKIVFLPVTWRESDQKSNINALRVGYKMLKTLFLWRLLGSSGKIYKNRSEGYYKSETFFSIV